VTWERLPAEEPAPGAKMRSERLNVTLPPYADMPDEGATLQISTNAAEEEYRQVTVRIVKVQTRPPATPLPSPQRGAP
jgi:hypothetical protein